MDAEQDDHHRYVDVRDLLQPRLQRRLHVVEHATISVLVAFTSVDDWAGTGRAAPPTPDFDDIVTAALVSAVDRALDGLARGHVPEEGPG